MDKFSRKSDEFAKSINENYKKAKVNKSRERDVKILVAKYPNKSNEELSEISGIGIQTIKKWR